MYDVAAIGELLIDFTPVGGGQSRQFEQNAGGAPANVLVAAAGMDKRTCFIGKVGNDVFGHFLRDQLQSRGVDTRGLKLTDAYKTTLAFVHLDEHGERSFSFYREPGADIMLSTSEIDDQVLAQTKVFHYGSVSLTHDPVRTATLQAVQTAKRHGAVITFDPNVRLPLWTSAADCKTQVLSAMQYADILKVSDEELAFLTDDTDMERAAQSLCQSKGLALVLVTLGPRGCYFRSDMYYGTVPGYAVRTVDTTGAGDGFMGAFIGAFVDMDQPLNQLTLQELESIVALANASGALTTTKRGGIPSLPVKSEILAFMAAHA